MKSIIQKLVDLAIMLTVSAILYIGIEVIVMGIILVYFRGPFDLIISTMPKLILTAYLLAILTEIGEYFGLFKK